MHEEAHLLREASKILREVAKEASQGDWDWRRPFGGDPANACRVVAYRDGADWDVVADEMEPENASFVAHMNPTVAVALADWLDAEYVTQMEMEPLANAYNAVFKAQSGLDAGLIEFGRDDDGEIVFRANTMPGALAVAKAVLG